MITFAYKPKVGVALPCRHFFCKRFRRKRIIGGDYSSDFEHLSLFSDGFHCESRADHHRSVYRYQHLISNN